MGLGATALGALLPQNAHAWRPGAAQAAAKRVIFLFMAGAPSQLDLFDYKPRTRQALQGAAPGKRHEGATRDRHDPRTPAAHPTL